jgi:hypothetical protein
VVKFKRKKDITMTNKEKLLKVLEEIGADYHISNDEYCDRVIVKNEYHDVEERAFQFKFKKDTEKYFE